MKKSNRGSSSIAALGVLFVVVFICLAISGYVSNIYKLTGCDFDPETPYKCEIIHTIGILPPVGIFTGYMSLEGE